jgi:hypothetical protein
VGPLKSIAYETGQRPEIQPLANSLNSPEEIHEEKERPPPAPPREGVRQEAPFLFPHGSMNSPTKRGKAFASRETKVPLHLGGVRGGF